MKTLNFPAFRQTYEWDCGASALQSILAYYGFDVRAEEIVKRAGTEPKTGTPINGLKKVLKKYQLHYQDGAMEITDIIANLRRKTPVILLLQAWTKKKHLDWSQAWSEGHYVVAIGYDAKNIYFADPANIQRTFLSKAELLVRWHDQDANNKKYVQWGLVVTGKKPAYTLTRAQHMD